MGGCGCWVGVCEMGGGGVDVCGWMDSGNIGEQTGESNSSGQPCTREGRCRDAVSAA
jgi:hypothetical protein